MYKLLPDQTSFVHLPPNYFKKSHHQASFLSVMLRVGQLLDQGTIICDQRQTLAVAVQTAGCIYIWHSYILFQRGMTRALIGKLREDTVGLVEKEITHANSRD